MKKSNGLKISDAMYTGFTYKQRKSHAISLETIFKKSEIRVVAQGIRNTTSNEMLSKIKDLSDDTLVVLAMNQLDLNHLMVFHFPRNPDKLVKHRKAYE